MTTTSTDDRLYVRLVRKLAECLDGIDVSAIATGEVFELPRRDAELLIAEGWAERVDHRGMSTTLDLAVAADAPRRAAARPPRAGDQVDGQRTAAEDARRLAEQVREELRDTRAIVLNGPATTASGD